MKKGPVVHGALLGVALLVAYQTWTRDRSSKPARGNVVVWAGSPDEVRSVVYDTERKTVRVERRGEGADHYLWGLVKRTTPAPVKPPPAPGQDLDGGVDMPEPAPPAAEPTVVENEFPVGAAGKELLGSVAPLLASRDLGQLDDAKKADYGLAESKDSIAVQIGEVSHSLVIGGHVYGGEDRYVLDPDTGKAYIVAAAILRPMEGADASLRERNLHAFKAEEVTRAVVKSASHERAMARGKTPAAEPGRPIPPATWSDAASPDKPDQTLANFMDRVDKLTPMDYDPKLTADGLTSVMRVEYLGPAGASIGYLELYKRPAAAAGQFDYFVKTELTRVLGKVNKMAADRVDQDLAQIFGA